jgi:hypothetical protein
MRLVALFLMALDHATARQHVPLRAARVADQAKVADVLRDLQLYASIRTTTGAVT